MEVKLVRSSHATRVTKIGFYGVLIISNMMFAKRALHTLYGMLG